jgi:general secretion pathway protein A
VVLAAGFVFAAFMGWRTWQNRPADVRAAAPPPAGSPPLPSETPPLAPATPLEPGAAQPVAAATPTVPGATLPLAGANSPAPSATPPLAAANSPVTSATPPLAAVNSTVTSATPPVAAANSPAPSATPPVAAAIPSLPISALLAANGAYTTDAVAFRRLLSLWGTAMTDDRDPCGQAQKAGLACLDQRGSWAQVRALNRPAILSLVDDTGHKHRVVISALDDNYATLDLGEHSQRVAVDEVSRDWPGDFTVIWKPKTTHTRELSVGMRGDEVRWLRRSLNALQGSTANPDHGDLYDEQLAIEVQNFQREHRLDVNGIAGLQTQAVLDTALADPDSPLLLRTTPTPRG